MSVKPKSGSRNTRRRNLLIVILVIVLASSLFAYTMVRNNGSNHVKTEVELREAIDKAPYEEPVTIIIDNDITLSRGTLGIPVGKNITLTSKSNVGLVKLISTTSDTFLKVDGELILDGLCVTHATGATGTGVGVNPGGTFTMYNSEISNNAGGVVNGGTFKMYSGTISNNAAENGGGVTNFATFEMYGGEISGNTATMWGGGVNNGFGTFNMYGGSIFGNTARVGGGVFCDTSGAFNNFGGTISGNTSTYYEDNVHIM